MDFSILFSVFDDILKCPECGNDMNSHADMKKKHGYSQYIVLQCKECDWKYYFNSSKKQRRQSFEIHVRASPGLSRNWYRGHNAKTNFSKIMNMPAREEITSPRFKIKSSCLL
jgi:DNA-directed RNA polymerase subunit M/transcription elongation factor TFIIS